MRTTLYFPISMEAQGPGQDQMEAQWSRWWSIYEVSTSYQKNTKSSTSDKFFGYCEPLYKAILHKEFKFKFPNLG